MLRRNSPQVNRLAASPVQPPSSVGQPRSREAKGIDGADDIIVAFDHVEKTYDGVQLAVRDLTLGIRRGEFLTLLGPSGSGKTTSLMMLAGFEAPTAGDIRMGGRSLSRVPAYRRNIGVVFQNYALFPHMTVAENIAFPLSVRRMPKAEIGAKVERALGLVRLTGFGLRRPAALSGGQQQRVALARALVFDPDLVLMDEPLGALDKQLREQLQIEIKHIQRDLGITVVYVTHDQSEALTMSDRVAVFKDGAVQQLAVPGDLYERPMSAFVAQFIGESNRLTGTVRAVDGDTCLVATEGGLEIAALAVNIGPPGSRTVLSLRPERIVLNPAFGQCENTVGARVEELIYHGDHTRVRLAVPGSSEFLTKVANAHGEISLAPGDAVTVGWRRQDCRALDAD
jgi:putative spermidine/putrescine transport system ATP-binding protein